jgi:SAM-dependent methyltransferase
MNTSTTTDSPDELSKIYQARFQGKSAYRAAVWRILIDRLLRPWIPGKGHILDLGAGQGEFINQVEARSKQAMDRNADTGKYLNRDVTFLQQDCSSPWKIPANSLDLVFTSNFFEHLPDKASLKKTLMEVHRALTPGGRLVALGPNIRLLPGAYWDFWDHHLPLTELSLCEAGHLCGFHSETCWAATLPYSMSQGFHPPLLFLQIYLRLPWLWPIFGKQFLVVLKKQE